jgi:WD40 repeat protein
MRTVALVGLCILLITACTTLGTKADNNTIRNDNSLQVTSQPSISVSLASGVPLYLWHESLSHYEIHLVDPITGADLPEHTPIVVSENTQFTGGSTLSANGQKIAIVASNGEYCYPTGGGTACMGRADLLHVINKNDWNDITAELPGKGWAGLISFSPDVTKLALTSSDAKSNTIMLFDANTGTLIAQQSIAFQPSLMGYTSDAATLALYGQPLGTNPGISKPDPPRVMLLDARTLKVKWEQTLPNVLSGHWCIEKCDASHGEQSFADWTPAVVLAPEHHKLYIVHADEERLTAIDLDARAVKTVEVQKAQSLLERVLSLTATVAKAKGYSNGAFKTGVLSPDETHLYVVGQSMSTALDANGELQETNESLGLEMIQVTNGEKLASAVSEATWIKITPDGTRLLLGNWGSGKINILDTSNLKNVNELGSWDAVAAQTLNGASIILASQSDASLTRLAVFDPLTFNIIRTWSAKTSYATWLSTP